MSVKQDWELAEKYDQHCIMLAYDNHDEFAKGRAERIYLSLYICRQMLYETRSQQ